MVDRDRGFLPTPDPLGVLPAAFAPWEEVARDLPKLLAADRLRRVLEGMPVLDTACLPGGPETHRAMVLLSYFGHAYVWGEAPPAARLPTSVAVPWWHVAQRLGRPPVLSYASYAQHNWRRMDPKGQIALGNLAILQNFLGGVDEDWFILVHVDIEAKAGRTLTAVAQAREAAAAGDRETCSASLAAAAAGLTSMVATLGRMPERCDPYIYYRRVRPYLHGWRDHPLLAAGVVYDGVEAYGGDPQQFRGETGAQSPIIPALDAALDIVHADDPLRPYLQEMRLYMPPEQRAFIQSLEKGPSLRAFVVGVGAEDGGLRDAYNACVEEIARFRSLHLEYAAVYIHRQGQRDARNPTTVGTGGTPFMRYLKKHRDETLRHRVQ